MVCPYLDYRRSAGEDRFEEARAYCTAADRFVQPMRADICNDRYDLHHGEHCEIYLAHEDENGSERDRGDETDGGNDASADDEPSSGDRTGRSDEPGESGQPGRSDEPGESGQTGRSDEEAGAGV